jgi:hypothetical protein
MFVREGRNDDASTSKRKGLKRYGVVGHILLEYGGKRGWHTGNRVGGAGVIFAGTVKLVKSNLHTGGTVMTLREEYEGRPAGCTVRMLRRREPFRARVRVVNRWSDCVLLIPRLRTE